MRRPSVSRMREIRTSGLTGGLRKRSQCATAPEAYQCATRTVTHRKWPVPAVAWAKVGERRRYCDLPGARFGRKSASN
jgi:hypothetical protein